MRVKDEIAQMVCFLAQDAGGGTLSTLGTGFFVQVRTPNPNLWAVYVVTAAHVKRQSKPSAPLLIRANREGGGLTDLPIPHKSWFEHPARNTDVAVAHLPKGSPPQPIVGLTISIERLFTQEQVESVRIGIGHEVVMLGLFVHHAGTERAEPVARFGHMALMAKEKVPIELDKQTPIDVEAYLVESLSWGGESGSPVLTVDREVDQTGPIVLGLVQGHFQMPGGIVKPGTNERIGEAELNSGMAVVIPAGKIIETLTQPALVAQRQRMADEYQAKRPRAVPDIAAAPTRKRKKVGRPRIGPKPPGPEPDRLKIDGDWKDAMARSLKVERPAGGWAKRPTRKRRPG